MATRNDVLKKFHPIILLCTLFSYIIRSNKMMAGLIQMECNSYEMDVHIYIRKNSENPSKQANKQIQALALQTFPSGIASGCRRFAIVCSLMCSYGIRWCGTAVHCTVLYRTVQCTHSSQKYSKFLFHSIHLLHPATLRLALLRLS